MSSRYHRMYHRLTDTFKPQFLELTDESNQHQVPKGAESHFKVLMVSDAFQELRPLARHQLIYKALSEELSNGLHALSMNLYTPEQWQQQPKPFATPPCQHKLFSDE